MFFYTNEQERHRHILQNEKQKKRKGKGQQNVSFFSYGKKKNPTLYPA